MTLRRAAAVACAVALAVSALWAASARAATYSVSACAAGGGAGVNNAWSAWAAGGGQTAWTGACVAQAGLDAEIHDGAPLGSADGFALQAPSGLTISGFRANFSESWTGGYFGAQLDDGQSVIWTPCLAGPSYNCADTASFGYWSSYGWAAVSQSGSWSRLRVGGSCLSSPYCSGTEQVHWADVYATITDTGNPTLTVTGPPSGWVSGTQTIGWSASDTSGIRHVRVSIDGSLVNDQVEPCDYSYLVPCHAQSGGYAIDTTQLADGRHTYSVEVRDATDSNATTQTGSFGVSNGVPGAAQIAAPPATNGWLNAAQATTYSPQVTMASGAGVPASGIAGYAVTTDGTIPGTTLAQRVGADGVSATVPPPAGGWPEGTDTIEARAISGTGVAATQVATLRIRVDRTPPSASAEGYGNPAPAWQPAPVSVRLVASDTLSGIGAADDGMPVTSDGYIAYTLDTGPRQTVPGGLATVQVTAAGQHWITFQAYDLAGNASQSKTVYVNVGSPTVASFSASGFWAQSVNPGSKFSAASGFGSSCPAQASLAPSHDTYVDQARPDQSFAASTALVVRSAQGANARSLLDFSLPPAQGCAVTSATLRLYSTASTAGRTLEVFRVGSPWTDTAATWNTRPGVTGSASTATTTASGWQALDVTSQVQDIYAYGDTGLLVRDQTEGAASAAGQSFTASEGGAVQQPQLVLTFG